MKFFILFALVACAVAEPESDAQFVVPTVYGNAHATAGLVHHLGSGAVTPDDTLSVKAAKVQHHVAKAVEYAKKPFVYAAPAVHKPVVYTQQVAQPIVQYTKPVVQYTKPVVYTHQVAQPVHYTYPQVGYHHLYKREADSDSDSQYYTPYAHNKYYNSYAGVYNYPSYSTYSSYYPQVYSGYHHLYKRDAAAEPESDSQFYYANAYNTPYVHNKYYNTYAGVYNYPSYSAYSSYYPQVYSGYHHLYKRDATAEPESDSQYYYANAYNTPYVHNKFYNAYSYYPYNYNYAAYSPYNNFYHY